MADHENNNLIKTLNEKLAALDAIVPSNSGFLRGRVKQELISLMAAEKNFIKAEETLKATRKVGCASKSEIAELEQNEEVRRAAYREARAAHQEAERECRTFQKTRQEAERVVIDIFRNGVLPAFVHSSKQAEELEQKHAALRTRLSEADQEKSQLRELVADLNQKMEEMRTGPTNNGVLAAEHVQELKKANARITELEKDVKLLSAVTVETPNHKLTEAIADLERAKEESANQLAAREAIQKKLEAIEELRDNVNVERDEYKQQIRSLNLNVEQLRDENDALEEKVKLDKESIKNLTKRKEELGGLCSKYEKRIIELESDLNLKTEEALRLKNELEQNKIEQKNALQQFNEEQKEQQDLYNAKLSEGQKQLQAIVQQANTDKVVYEREIFSLAQIELTRRQNELTKQYQNEYARKCEEHTKETTELRATLEVRQEELDKLRHSEQDARNSAEWEKKFSQEKQSYLAELLIRLQADNIDEALRKVDELEATAADAQMFPNASEYLAITGPIENSESSAVLLPASEPESHDQQIAPTPKKGKCKTLVKAKTGIIRYCKNPADPITGRCNAKHRNENSEVQARLLQEYQLKFQLQHKRQKLQRQHTFQQRRK